MAELIYIAESPQYPGIVKIGRTDREVHIRMEELSNNNYGMPGADIDSQWEAIKVIKVEDNVHSEAILHDYFESQRVIDSRELFYTDDPNELAYEAESIVDGTILTGDLIEIWNLFDPLSVIALSAAIVFTAKTFAPDNKTTKKTERFIKNWEFRTNQRFKNSKTTAGKFVFGGLYKAFIIKKYIGVKTGKLVVNVISKIK